VLVGAAASSQRCEDPDEAVEPLELMARALEGAANDAGAHELLARADAIRIPRGFWNYADPGRALVERFGAPRARTQIAEVGILQTTLFGHAARDIAAGAADVVLVCGGEAKHRSLRAQIAGTQAPLSQQQGAVPDEVLQPHAEILPAVEIERGLAQPVSQYAIIESALRHAEGLTLDAHLREIAEMWSRFSDVAAQNPDAWNRQRVSAQEIRCDGDRNRMLAFPYTKLHCSQWNVDQAAGLIFCSLETARALGVPEQRWLFPRAITESNHMLPLSQRPALHGSPGFRVAGRRALETVGTDADGIAHLELYSCFPAAVRVQARELGIGLDRTLTQTGGMTFGGGPLNNFVLQALVKLAAVLRADPGTLGMLTAISGLITKQGVSLWSTDPGQRAFRFEDVTEEVAAVSRPRKVDAHASGAGTVAGYTVLYEGTEPARGIAICDLEDGRRAIGVAGGELARAMTREEFCGRRVQIRDDGGLELRA
jgi:acetyl-CoA C-acetyltransferase